MATTLNPGQDPEDYLRILPPAPPPSRPSVEYGKSHYTARKVKDVMVRGLTEDYNDIKLVMCGDRSFDIDPCTMRHLYLDDLSGKNPKESRIAGYRSDMVAE